MTDDETRDVFAELERLGVDLGRPPGLALGTGFRDGEFLAWLRLLPNALGHDDFVKRLNDRVNDAQPNVAPVVSVDEPARPQRLWPTIEQLDAGIDVLVREWDPLGARLGNLSREAVADAAECGAIGTVAVVMRDVEPFVSRYCPSCWSNARGRYLTDFSHVVKDADRSTPDGMIASLDRMYDKMELQAREQPRYVASAMWDDAFPFLRAALGSGDFVSPAHRERELRSLADEIVHQAPAMYGPMPPDIEAFVREHGASDA